MLTIRGRSDDLIELEGDIVDEFTYGYRPLDDADGDLLGFSDGTILRIIYTPSGVWRIAKVAQGAARLTIEQAPEGDSDNYSDVATLDSAVWVVHGRAWARR